MAEGIDVTAEAVPDGRYRFKVNAPVHALAPGAYRFASPADAAGVPVAEAVLAVPGVDAVVLADDAVTVEKQSSHEWCDLEERVQYAITTAMSGMQATPKGVAPAMDDDAMFDAVVEIFRVEINPQIASHGGAVELIDVQDGTVVLRMQGGCQGCGMANVTLRQGIEGTLRRALPSLKGIQDVTDHTAGTDPYFSSAKT
jgi:Fe-S cluster biogenesis protein NfuA